MVKRSQAKTVEGSRVIMRWKTLVLARKIAVAVWGYLVLPYLPLSI